MLKASAEENKITSRAIIQLIKIIQNNSKDLRNLQISLSLHAKAYEFIRRGNIEEIKRE